MDNFVVKTEQFSGPMQKLLELIEDRKMEISTLSLAEVTADFILYINTISKIAPSILADFTAVASKLILIKSKSLLPNLKLENEEEKEIELLKEQLELYKGIRMAGKSLASLWSKPQALFGRQLFLGRSVIFCPGLVSLMTLHESFKRINEFILSSITPHSFLKIPSISLEKKIEDLMDRINKNTKSHFSSLMDSNNRAEIVVIFLAILHLIKDKFIKVDQNQSFSDILIKKNILQ